MPVVHLDDRDDPRIAPYRNVPDPELLRTHGLFVAEGRLVVRTLLTASPLRTRSLLVTETALSDLRDLADSRADIPVFVAPQRVLSDIVGFNIHRGCLALGERPPVRSLRELLEIDASRLVVLENVSNADNVGGIFRSVAALGGDGVVMGPHCCDPLYRKAIRTSIGASLVVPFGDADAWPGAMDLLRAAGCRVVALTPGAGARSLEEVAAGLSREERLAVVAGAEGTGLTEAALGRADVHVRIPMTPGMDSLNVTVAVGIALHRLARVRV
jgi:tRNA G18 (ribose-2'-O)-methylase SpoU